MNELIQQYANAIRARPLLRLLPPGPREYALQFERDCMNDIRIAMGNTDLTESEILAMAPSTTSKIVQALLPLTLEIATDYVKKHYPAALVSGAVSAIMASIVTYLTTK